MSNLSTENPLGVYAQQMADYIDETYHKTISVHVPNTVGEQFTIIIPPTKTDGKTWKIRVLDHIPDNAQLDLDNLIALTTEISEKEMNAEQLKNYMDNPQLTNKPSSIDSFTDSPRDRPAIRR